MSPETPGHLLPKLLEHLGDLVYIPSELPAVSWGPPGSMNLFNAISFWGGFQVIKRDDRRKGIKLKEGLVGL